MFVLLVPVLLGSASEAFALEPIRTRVAAFYREPGSPPSAQG